MRSDNITPKMARKTEVRLMVTSSRGMPYAFAKPTSYGNAHAYPTALILARRIVSDNVRLSLMFLEARRRDSVACRINADATPTGDGRADARRLPHIVNADRRSAVGAGR